MRTTIDTNSAVGRRAVDALFALYLSWRETCDAVQQAYERWTDADRAQRGPAYAGYVAALDGEEHAARVYADQIERISRSSA